MLPPLYARWMGELLEAPLPAEPHATCDRCAMRPAPGAAPEPDTITFGEGKCCTYQPRVHSFLAGRILGDASPSLARARALLEEALASGSGVTPAGILGPQSYWLLYDGCPGAFGRSARMRCSLFDPTNGRCGAWPYLESTCATWFCKHDRGAAGQAFWRAIHDLLLEVERSLVAWCAMELEWGPWRGREREYFLACAEKVEALDWAEVLALGGAETRLRVEVVHHRLAALSQPTSPSARLRLGPCQLSSANSGQVRLTTYSPFDPLEVSPAVARTLGRFDGRPADEVLKEIRALDGVEIPPDVLGTLVDFRVLLPSDAGAGTNGSR